MVFVLQQQRNGIGQMIGRLIQDAFTVQGQLQFTNGSVVLYIHAQVVVVEGQQQGGWLCHVVQPFGDKDKGIVFVPGGCQCLGLDGRSCRGRMKRNGSILKSIKQSLDYTVGYLNESKNYDDRYVSKVSEITEHSAY